MTQVKTCKKCNQEKSLDCFSPSKSGHQTYCKACRSAYRKQSYYKNHQQELTWRKDYLANNKEKCRESIKQWYKKNRKKVAAYQKKYQAKNRDRLNAYCREQRDNMTDVYIKALIKASPSYNGEAITADMIQQRRAALAVKRAKLAAQ